MGKTSFLSAEQVLKNGNSNSSVNQRIKDDFIGKHVYANVGTMVEYILKKSYEDSEVPFSMDDVENMYSFPEFNGEYAKFDGGSQTELYAEIARLENSIAEIRESVEHLNPEDEEDDVEIFGANERIDDIQEEIDELNNLESAPQEVYEWWAVSSFLYEKLKALGHPVLEAGALYVWGRCTTGQAISLDYAISQICAEMEILDGQENSWAKY